ncbi:hypothetical protein GIY23_15025 [Allosaccharopolyspora coralli]|uniref:Uncharacterized protein n=2 Tax=Allosaccharopolyspora coralli TaxID=2665642 RepID=A0A5Q3QEE0_9PSEU|nr:hypothetical protein GIY23_15025 [Allosaccharopolyspora coralli]
MLGRVRKPGRHRLGTPGLTHCSDHPTVSGALAVHRRRWISGLLVPAKHSLAGLRRRAVAAARARAWAPTVATA